VLRKIEDASITKELETNKITSLSIKIENTRHEEKAETESLLKENQYLTEKLQEYDKIYRELEIKLRK